MNILWLSWRDINNPQSGGAEIITHQTAKRLVRAGHSVTILTAYYQGSKKTETVDGVKIIRSGNRLTCRFWAFLKYQKKFKRKIDIVIDEINTIPFFTNFYVKEKKVMLIHQLAREFWHSETFFPLNLIGYILEPLYLKTYQGIPTIACSNSTRKDLLKLGFTNVTLYHHGLTLTPPSKLTPKNSPQILYIGRLTKPKGPQDAICAFKVIHQKIPTSRLKIAGLGKPEFIHYLKSEIKKNNLEDFVEILGFVSQEEKIKLLKNSKIVLIPSIREGWNMVPVEANALGTIPVGYNVPGLCDSIQNGKTGLLTKPNPKALAKATIKLLLTPNLQKTLSANGLSWAKQFNFEKTYQSFKKVIVDH
jgi:glycosyltransferase involved in cell wall biosynthesis